jgi:hypothetical protein
VSQDSSDLFFLLPVLTGSTGVNGNRNSAATDNRFSQGRQEQIACSGNKRGLDGGSRAPG